MTRVIGIDWDTRQLCLIEAQLQHGQLTLRRALVWPETISPNPVQAEEAGLRLRERLLEAGIAPAPVYYAVGRDRLLFREVRYPEVPAGEVPAVVRFQAAKEVTFPLEEAVVDYAPSSIPGPAGEKRALVAVLRKELLGAIQQACQTAGLKLEGLTARPFALLANWQAHHAAAPAAEVFAILIVGRNGAELCVAHGPELLFSRALAVSDTVPDMLGNGLLAELRRSLAAYASQFPAHPIRALYLAGPDALAGATDRLSGILRLPVRIYDPLAGASTPDLAAEQRAVLGGAWGMLQARAAHQRLAVDFLAVKEPRPPANPNKRYLAIAAAAVLVLLAGGGIMYGWAAAARNGRVEELQLRKATLQKQITDLADVEKRFEKVTEWANAEVVVLDELYDLFARFPDHPGIRITKITLSPLVEAARPTTSRPTAALKTVAKPAAKPVAQLTIEASADSSDALDRLKRSLEGVQQWRVDYWDAISPTQAKATLKVFRQQPQDYQVVLGSPENRNQTTSQGERRSGPEGRRGFERGGRP